MYLLKAVYTGGGGGVRKDDYWNWCSSNVFIN